MLSFKKSSVIVLSALFLLIGCQEENDLVGLDYNRLEDEEKVEKIHSEGLKDPNFNINNLDDLIHNSDAIIMGTVMEAKPFDSSGTYQYIVSVDSPLMGPTPSNTINVYEIGGALEVGKQYALFLNYYELELYPNPIYNLIDESIIIEIQEQNLIGAENIIAGKTTKELKNYIKNSNTVSLTASNSASVGNVVTDSVGSTKELVDLSSNIIHIIPKEINAENPYVKNFNVSIVNVLKGSIAYETLSLNLPSTVEVGKEYIVFLQDGLDYLLATRKGSVVSKEEEETWQAINELVNSIK